MKISCFLSAICILISASAFAQDKKYTVVFLQKNPQAPELSKEESKKIMDGHMANIEAMARDKRLLAAGPFEGGGGLFVMNTTSTEEINKWLANDPGVQAHRWNLEMLPYSPRYGGVCAVQAPYQMVMYSFIRFDAVVSKYTAGTYPQIISKHNEYLKKLAATGNVVTEAIFGEHDGGILVMKGDVTKDIFESDPAVQDGLVELTIKQLYIAKGSFCEQ
jgi:uncharacterized protein YciI